jgi:hypothetical protein
MKMRKSKDFMGGQIPCLSPPHDDLFGMFHKNSTTISATPAIPQPAFVAMPYMGMPPYGYMPWGVHGGPPPFPGTPDTPTPAPRLSHAPQASTSTSAPAFLSSNPPDMGAPNPYTEISEFITQLHEYHPKHRLLDYIDRFEDLDYYNINEIAKLGTANSLAGLVGITHGNVAFLLQKVKDEMKRIDRASK